MDNLRLFLGVALAEPLKPLVGAVSEAMAADLPFRKWTLPPDYHVTLHFFGDVPASSLPPIRAAATDVAASSPSFRLELTHPGIFGSADRPRVLWLGMAPSEPLVRLQASLAARLRNDGFPVENRPYAPHLTLARNGTAACSRAAMESVWRSAEARYAPDGPFEWTADGITLFRSHIGRKPSYEPIDFWPFEAR